MAVSAKLKIAYHIKKEEGRDKPFFNRIGKAFVNKDNSLNLVLEYLPMPTINKDGTVEPMVERGFDHFEQEGGKARRS